MSIFTPGDDGSFHEDPAEPAPDGEGFDPALVPEEGAEWFRSARDGHGLSNAEYDEMAKRWRDAGLTPPWEDNTDIEKGYN